MNDDLDYVRGRLDPYRSYVQEGDRHDSDMRVRAYVGNALTQTQTRLGNDLDGATRERLDAVLMRCMFTDQTFIRKFEHAELDGPTIAALIRSDRKLIESADVARTADAVDLRAVLEDIDRQFDGRRSPEPVV